MEIRPLRHFPAAAREENMTRPRSNCTVRPPGGLFRGLTFRPLSPWPDSGLYLIRNRYQAFTPIAERFLARVRRNAPA